MDFFGGQGGASKGPIVGKAITKKIISGPRPTGSGSGSGSSSAPATAGRSTPTIAKPVARPAAGSAPAPAKKALPVIASTSAKAGPSRPIAGGLAGPSGSKAHLSATSSRASTPSSRRKRTPSPVRSESSSNSDSGSESPKAKKAQEKKRKRVDAPPTGGSGSATPVSVGRIAKPGVRREGEEKRELWCLDKVDERGEWGRGWAGFVGSEAAVRQDVLGFAGGKGEGKVSLDKYMAYFDQEGFGNQEPLPSVELLYPAVGCKERFVLLVPTSSREYNPISELKSVLKTILEHYIPPSHAHLFGTLSDSIDLDPLPLPSRLHSPLPPSSSLATPPPDPSTSSPAPTPATLRQETIGDALRKALANNRRDGPGFTRAVERYNTAMADLQRSGEMQAWMREKSGVMGQGEWSSVVEVVHEQAYSRVVGPYSDLLEHHPKHPDEVAKAISGKEDAYGELRHKFMSQIVHDTHLTPSSTFVDLGSGVANCVLQTALQAGCRSLGVELLPVPAHCARLQVAEVKKRWAMWGLNGHIGVEVKEGDFRTGEVGRWLASADVVLVNNEVFPPALNDDLKNMFLDLKEGAKIISLKPFVNEGFRMNENNCDSFDAIVRLSVHNYYQDWVSWKGDSGRYYVQVIDRSKRRKFDEEMKGGRRRR